MLDRTRRLRDTQFGSVGDRRPLFEAVADAVAAISVVYPGSYVDLTPAFVWPEVTFLDIDRRAHQFLDDTDGIDELIEANEPRPGPHRVDFVHADYTDAVDLPDQSFDLLVSLYAGFVSEHCTRHVPRRPRTSRHRRPRGVPGAEAAGRGHRRITPPE